ncbi:MAG: enoyl-CoA hydratase/isomerase family protein [Candidatus Dadabacteria bacterium]|nr:enoyl-CoA hydratase/isomerase family protein [Candidatus Dadabacteria bacterium]MCY4261724.1 enoyl-CoA hydratase/isomerase family protein [Candidatus Dadabacteria bacterium]
MSWEIQRTDGVAVVRMNSNPMNVMNELFFNDLDKAFLTLASDHAESPVVLTSSQRAFSAGLDLKYHLSLFASRDEEEMRRWYKRFCGALLQVFTYERPVVAAVNGHAIAGGLILALCCDYGVCVDSEARFGLNEITIGFPLPSAVAQIVLYALGSAVTRRVITTGFLYDSQDAVSLGFFNESRKAGELLSHCVAFAGQYGPSLIPGYAFSKKALRREVVANMKGVCADFDRDLPATLCSRGVLKSLGGLVETLGKKK